MVVLTLEAALPYKAMLLSLTLCVLSVREMARQAGYMDARFAIPVGGV